MWRSVFKHDVYIFISNAAWWPNAMSRFEGPAVCFFHNPHRLDHMISIRLGSLQLDYTNGRLQNATVTLCGIVESMHSAFYERSVVSRETHKCEFLKTLECPEGYPQLVECPRGVKCPRS